MSLFFPSNLGEGFCGPADIYLASPIRYQLYTVH